jgi:hypothetical protein
MWRWLAAQALFRRGKCRSELGDIDGAKEDLDRCAHALYASRERRSQREWTWWAHTGGGNALAFKQPTWPYDIESGPGGLTREVETPLPSNSPRDHMILRVDLVGSHARGVRFA